MSKARALLFIRADASPQIGAGHVMRMLALAQAWQDFNVAAGTSAEVFFLCAQMPAALAQRVRDEGFAVTNIGFVSDQAADASATLAALAAHFRKSGHPSSDLWLVADGYRFGAGFQRGVRAPGVRLAIMDDNGENTSYDCDVILNQNIMACEPMYFRRNAETKLLLGSRYALLRREFRAAQFSVRQAPARVRNVMMTFGGADTVDLVLAVLESLREVQPPLNIRCVLGAMAGSSFAVKEIQASSPHRIEILQDVRDMTGVMRWADLSINAAGSTTWELCAMGVPMILVVLADNQRQIGQTLDKQGCAVSTGDITRTHSVGKVRELFVALADAPDQRKELARRARELVDGRGAMRVAEWLAHNRN